MAGDTAPGADNAQALWDQVAKEREAGEESPSQSEAPDLESTAEVVEASKEAEPSTTQEKTEEKTQEAADPFAGLSPEVQARLKRLEAMESQLSVIPQLTQSLKTAEGRVAAMQREMDAAKAAAKATSGGPTQAQIAAAAGSTDKWAKLRSDFPEWADATEEFVKASLAGVSLKQDGLTSEQVDQLVREKLTASEATTKREIEFAKVEGKYENWREVINTPQFTEWYGKQPPELLALGASETARDAIKLLDTYHKAIATPADKVAEDRKAKLAAAASGRPSPTPQAARKTVDQMSPQELWEYERQRSAKKNAGLTY